MNNNKKFSNVISNVFECNQINPLPKSSLVIHLEWLIVRREKTAWAPQCLQGKAVLSATGWSEYMDKTPLIFENGHRSCFQFH